MQKFLWVQEQLSSLVQHFGCLGCFVQFVNVLREEVFILASQVPCYFPDHVTIKKVALFVKFYFAETTVNVLVLVLVSEVVPHVVGSGLQ